MGMKDEFTLLHWNSMHGNGYEQYIHTTFLKFSAWQISLYYFLKSRKIAYGKWHYLLIIIYIPRTTEQGREVSHYRISQNRFCRLEQISTVKTDVFFLRRGGSVIWKPIVRSCSCDCCILYVVRKRWYGEVKKDYPFLSRSLATDGCTGMK